MALARLSRDHVSIKITARNGKRDEIEGSFSNANFPAGIVKVWDFIAYESMKI